jgi:hypothetical protein
MRDIERLLVEDAAELETVRRFKTYKGFCVHRHSSEYIQPTSKYEEDEEGIASRNSVVLEFISILCEHIPFPMKGAVKYYDFSFSSVDNPVAIELPKYRTTQRVRLPSCYRDPDDMVNIIHGAVKDLDVHKTHAGGDSLSELLPVGQWHRVKIRLKVINLEKNYIYEEYSPQPCGISRCHICREVTIKKEKVEKEKRSLFEQNLEKHLQFLIHNTVKRIEEANNSGKK